MKENKISGVYKISNKFTGDFYIGSSKNIMRRWYDHRNIAEWKRQPNSRLYKDMAEFGRENFTIEVIEQTTDLRAREQYYIEQLKPNYNNYRADGRDIKRYRETGRRYTEEWQQIHYNEYLTKNKTYYSRLCLYEGETLTLAALSHRFRRQGIPNSVTEAKKYLV